MAIGCWKIRFLTFVFLFASHGAAIGEAAPFPGSKSFLAEPDILPVDEVFRLSAKKKNGSVQLYWQIMPGYYLYRHRLKADSDADLGELSMLPGEAKFDEYFGHVEVYYEALEVDVPILGGEGEVLNLTVEYQGCADSGICYPPQKKQISL